MCTNEYTINKLVSFKVVKILAVENKADVFLCENARFK